MSSDYERRRSGRKREVRAESASRRHLNVIVDIGRRLWPPDDQDRMPETRAGCAAVERPCPHVGCRHNLYLDAGPNGTIKFNFPDLEPWEMPAAWSCALDVADRGGETLERVGEAMNMVRERVRQVETAAYAKLRVTVLETTDLAPEDGSGERSPSREVAGAAGDSHLDADAFEGFLDVVTEHANPLF